MKPSNFISTKPILLLLIISLFTITKLVGQKCGFDTKHSQLLKQDANFANNLKLKNAEWAKIKSQFAPNNILPGTDTIAIVVHVYHLGEAVGTGTNISDAQIQSAINNLNDAYGATGPYSGSTDVGLRFALARYDTNCNPFSGIIRINASGYTAGGDNYGTVGFTDNNDAALKSISKYPNDSYYNIWVASEIDGNNGGSGVQGYAYFAGASASVDGTVILHNSFGYDQGGSIGYELKSYTNLNVTTTHELGHAFNVYHTFQGDDATPTSSTYTPQCPSDTDCGTNGDCCDDTDPHQRSSSNCPASSTANSCTGGTLGDLPKNFMDYSSDVCQVMFTPDQGARIAAAMAGGRASLKNSIGLTGLPGTFTTPSAASCQTTTSSTGLNGGFGGLIEIKIGTKSAISNPTKYDEMAYGGSGYLDFTGDCEKTFIIEENGTYSYNLETFFNAHNIKAWIDYDNDDTYEASELIFNANTTGEANSGSNTTSGSFTVPATAVTDTYLKLRVLCDIGTVVDACDNPTYGQSENYPIFIKSVVTCPTSSTISGTATTCGETTNLTVAIIGGTGPYTVVYNDGSSNTTINGYSSGSNIPVTPSTTTTYTLVSVTDGNGCLGTGNTGSAIVTVNEGSTAAVMSGTTTTCGENTNLSVAITGGASPYTVIYNDGSSNTTINSYTSGSNISVAPMSTTTYTLVSVTDNNGCVGTGNTGSAVVTVNEGSTAAVMSGTTTITNGNSTPISVAITGGSGPYSLVYSDGNSNTTLGSYGSGVPISVSPTVNTTYTIVSITDANGCVGTGNTGSAIITVNDPPSCPNTLNVTAVAHNEIYAAANTLTSSIAILLNNTVTFNAGQSITLGVGFHAAPTSGFTFTAAISSCAVAQAPAVARNNNLFDNLETQTALTISPNPARDFLTIDYQLDKLSTTSIGLYDMTGKRVIDIVPAQTQAQGKYQQQLSLGNLSEGMYFVLLQTATEQISQKLIVVR